MHDTETVETAWYVYILHTDTQKNPSSLLLAIDKIMQKWVGKSMCDYRKITIND